MTATNSRNDWLRPQPDPRQLAAFWEQHASPGEVYELRILNPKRDGPRRLFRVLSGYFDDPESFLREARSITGHDAAGVYCSLNPVLPDLLARARNRLAAIGIATADNEVALLQRLLIDVDSHHPRGVCATDDEREAAIGLRYDVQHFLRDEMGWPEPEKILVTGNGAALHYRLADLENTMANATLVTGCLTALATLFNLYEDSGPRVDPVTGNPSRLTRIPGSVNALGDGSAARPWRLVTATYNRDVVPVELDKLQALAALAPEPAIERQPTHRDVTSPQTRGWDIRQVLREAGIAAQERPYGNGVILRLDRCLTSTAHTDGAAIIDYVNGALAYKCHHASCSGKRWAEARQALPIPRPPERTARRSDRPTPFRGFEFRHGKVVDR